MTVTLHSTSKIVMLVVNGVEVPARLWEGRTDQGIRCHAYITRIAAAKDENLAEFESDLLEQHPPSPAVEAIPIRLIL